MTRQYPPRFLMKIFLPNSDVRLIINTSMKFRI